MQMLGKPPGVQSAEKGHFKRQPHVNLPEHDYRILYIPHSLSVLWHLLHAVWRYDSKHNRWLQGYGASLLRQGRIGAVETRNENIGHNMKTFLAPPNHHLHLSDCPTYPSSVLRLSHIRLSISKQKRLTGYPYFPVNLFYQYYDTIIQFLYLFSFYH